MEATTNSRTELRPAPRIGLTRRMYHQVLGLPGLAAALRYAQTEYATVFMLHRFRDGASGTTGLDARLLREGLEYLRRNRFELISLDELFRRLAGDGPPLRGAVAFTLDDGYRDQAEVAAPIFREFDCPVTTFLTTGFLDRTLWLWWDKIEYIFKQTSVPSFETTLNGTKVRYDLASDMDLGETSSEFAERCKLVDDEEKDAAVDQLAAAAEVDLPASAPPMFAPMTWDEVRSCEKLGMAFGPHTVSHPILSQMSAERAEHEIAESWRRVRSEVANPVRIFCYPNGEQAEVRGGVGDFGKREVLMLQRLGFLGGFSTERGYAVPRTFQRRSEEPFVLRRLTFPEDHAALAQCASGIERLKLMIGWK